MNRRIPRKKTFLEKLRVEIKGEIRRTMRLLKRHGSFNVVERGSVFLKGMCGKCQLIACQKNNFQKPVPRTPRRRFQKVLVKSRGRLFEAYQCPECGHLADADQTECLMQIGSKFIY